MKLSVLLSEPQIITSFNPQGKTKDQVIKLLVDSLWASDVVEERSITQKQMIDALIEREHEQTTALGEGIAFPHARIDGLSNFYMFFAVSDQGVDFGALDGEKVHFFIMTICPREKPNLLLKTRAAITRFLMLDNMQTLMKKLSSKQIWRMIDDSDIMVNARILAKDMMKPVASTLSPNMTLSEAAVRLHQGHEDCLPVVDEQGRFIRIFSCYDLFTYGIPKFFSNLYSISYVKDMDPFEKYFLTDRTRTIAEIELDPELTQPVLGPNSTIMEIIFEMTTHNRHHIFIIDENNKLLGVLDRYTIVDKILMNS